MSLGSPDPFEDKDKGEEFDNQLREFLASLEDEDSPEAPVEREPNPSATHTLHKREPQTYEVEVQVMHLYKIQVGADSPEEASTKAMENIGMLEPEQSRAHIAGVEPVYETTVARLEAAWGLVNRQDLNPVRRIAQAGELIEDIKLMKKRIEDGELDVTPDELDRINFLHTEIVESIMGE